MRKASALWLVALSGAWLTVALAQQPEEVEPAVDTSAAQSPEPESSPAESSEPAPTQSAPERSAPPRTSASSSGGSRAVDRLELDTTQITGNRELPKVLYIVPWKRSDLGDLVGKPVNSLLDEVLTPVDRDVFRRENRYYRALEEQDPGQTPASAGPQPAGAER